MQQVRAFKITSKRYIIKGGIRVSENLPAVYQNMAVGIPTFKLKISTPNHRRVSRHFALLGINVTSRTPTVYRGTNGPAPTILFVKYKTCSNCGSTCQCSRKAVQHFGYERHYKLRLWVLSRSKRLCCVFGSGQWWLQALFVCLKITLAGEEQKHDATHCGCIPESHREGSEKDGERRRRETAEL